MSSLFPNYFCTTLPPGSPVTSGMDYCQEFLDSLPFYVLPVYHSNLSKMQGLAVCIQSFYYSQRERPGLLVVSVKLQALPCSAAVALATCPAAMFMAVSSLSLLFQITLLIKIFAVLPMLTRFLSFPSVYHLGLYQVSFFPHLPLKGRLRIRLSQSFAWPTGVITFLFGVAAPTFLSQHFLPVLEVSLIALSSLWMSVPRGQRFPWVYFCGFGSDFLISTQGVSIEGMSETIANACQELPIGPAVLTWSHWLLTHPCWGSVFTATHLCRWGNCEAYCLLESESSPKHIHSGASALDHKWNCPLWQQRWLHLLSLHLCRALTLWKWMMISSRVPRLPLLTCQQPIAV